MSKSIGSLWRRWDLHFHTPSSFEYGNKAVTNEQIVLGLIGADISAVAITDHHVIDIDRINAMREIAGDELVIFPGIELRSELGSKPIHYIGIFPEDIDLDYLWRKVEGSLGLTTKEIRDHGGDERIYVPIKVAFEVFQTCGGLISIHAGEKSNSIEGIRNTEQFQQRIKYDVAKNFVDIFEVGQIKDVSSYKDIVFPATGLQLPIITGSDNHNINEYDPFPHCWLKADLTFTGLRQVINEPESRVWLGDKPEHLRYVELNNTRYINSLTITKKGGSSLKEKWFESVSLEFNTGLVAIIGNKGSGKSALTDILGLLGDSSHQESFAFLNISQFRHPKYNKAKEFDATLTWKNGSTKVKNLNDSVTEGALESVKYIPQFHLDTICDDLKGGKAGKFNDEIEQVIFSRVPPEDKLETDSLNELVELRTKDSKERIRQLQSNLTEVVEELAALERKTTNEYLDGLKHRLEVLNKELEDHEGNKPPEVKKSDEKVDKGVEIIREKISECEQKIKEISEEIRIAEQSLASTVKNSRALETIKGRIENLEREYKGVIRLNADALKNFEIEIDDVLKMVINYTPIDSRLKKLGDMENELRLKLDEEKPKSLFQKRNEYFTTKTEQQGNLDQKGKQYQDYLDSLAEWQERKGSLIGDKNTRNTKTYLETRIAEVDTIPELINDVKKSVSKLISELFREKNSILKIYSELYAPIQEFAETHPIVNEQFGLEFSVHFVSTNLQGSFFTFINQGRKGSFHGEADGNKVFQELLMAADIQSEKGIKKLLDDIDAMLHFDHRKEHKPAVELHTQLRQGMTTQGLYEFLFDLEYLEPRLILKWEGKLLEQLSPGERGALLLIFFLLVDDTKTPLIIDQPEGNLDNQTVYELLVGCIKEAKMRRQLILVTHNPNLAVVCDAEQIFYATLDKEDDYKIQYDSGALENPVICGHIINVLEGTKPALDNRIAKYRIIFDK